jgi:hypothetical protein
VTEFRLVWAAIVASLACGCETQMPAGDAWGATPVGVKRVSPRGVSVAIHPKFGGSDESALGVGGPAGDRTRQAAVNGAQTPDANGCAGKTDGSARCADSTIHVCVGGAEYLLDCDKFAQNDGWDGGECVETDVATDCFGCQAGNDKRACCDVQKATACCDQSATSSKSDSSSNACWKP